MKSVGCPLCEGPGGALVFQARKFRVIRVDESGFPAFYRLVWTDHVSEFSQLGAADRHACMDAVALVEQTLRDRLRPAKVNLAALGNVVPHLHWHVIARFEWDSHFPAPVWANAQRDAPESSLEALRRSLPALDAEIARSLVAFAD
jgi:diadenosine tetraphosphate (Ap4A) HIT family hydrolase